MADAAFDPGLFPKTLPPSRLGKRHGSLDKFHAAIYPQNRGKPTHRPKRKEYSLVVVTESQKRRILLGLKHRGFGSGFYNSFGGKLDKDEAPVVGAVRELEEEANIKVPLDVMKQGEVGTLNFTFDDDDELEMVVHLFRVDAICSVDEPVANEERRLFDFATFVLDPAEIRGCDEITPEWFDDWAAVPLDKMFADDSIWLTRLLSADSHFRFNGWFHFHPGGQDVNSIKHFCFEVKPEVSAKPIPCETGKDKFSLEKRLFHELHHVRSPSIKEFKECWSFASSIQRFYGKNAFDVIIDVAGGHGMLASLLLILTSSKRAVVVDPAVVGGIDFVRRAWSNFYEGKTLLFRHECLRSGLPDELRESLSMGIDNMRILVVACHACQHLSDETVHIATEHGVHVAVLPCCQKDQTEGSWKAAGKSLGVNIGPLMDILLAGKVMGWETGRPKGVLYRVKMKLIDHSITPQNRLIMCRAEWRANHESIGRVEQSHKQIERAYQSAHSNRKGKDVNYYGLPQILSSRELRACLSSAAVGLFAGVFISAAIMQRRS